MTMMTLSRRAVLAALPLGLAGCGSRRDFGAPVAYLRRVSAPLLPAWTGPGYGAMPDELFPVPAVNLAEIDPDVLRRRVRYDGPETPRTVIVDTPRRRLFLVEGDGVAMRYGVGVGREGFAWSGRAVIGRKAEWPRWTPTADMIRRDPVLYAPWAGGMEPGLQNPLGARALYLHQNGRDTLYRIHGTNEPWTIGRNVSSGCIRMFNQDVVDLYERVPVGAPVVVRV
jgi:lipoprotein-anchoring transpeptidase ErfK/SrfK